VSIKLSISTFLRRHILVVKLYTEFEQLIVQGDPKIKAIMFHCPHLHNAWTNLHDFWDITMPFCSQHIAQHILSYWSLIKLIKQSGAT